MSQKKKVVALVPMRHHSQRVKGKNYRELAGKPLFHHILDTLKSCSEIDAIVVDTDSPIIMERVRSQYPEIVLLERLPWFLINALVGSNQSVRRADQDDHPMILR